MNKEEQIMLMENLASVLIRCFFLIVALNLLWFVFFLLGGDWAYYLHSRWFELSSHDYDLVFYHVMALTKVVSFAFFLFPYIAIKLVIRKAKKA